MLFQGIHPWIISGGFSNEVHPWIKSRDTLENLSPDKCREIPQEAHPLSKSIIDKRTTCPLQDWVNIPRSSEDLIIWGLHLPKQVEGSVSRECVAPNQNHIREQVYP